MSSSTIATALVLLLCMALSQAHFLFTDLEMDNHPCKPENLRHTKRYICDTEGLVICQSGWTEPQVQEELNKLNPCLEPICEQNGIGCVHGECREPNFCACEVGWEGASCDNCVPLPGCNHGSCSNAFECSCDAGWAGAFCDIAVCDGCHNGDCVAPNECVCSNGWSGANCTECEPMQGCVNGICNGHPHTCECLTGWEGHFCNMPVCSPKCGQHGVCDTLISNGTNVNYCLCENGWRGDSCEKCRPYWNCPNQDDTACINPNQCFCNGIVSDPNGLCGNFFLTNGHLGN